MRDTKKTKKIRKSDLWKFDSINDSDRQRKFGNRQVVQEWIINKDLF